MSEITNEHSHKEDHHQENHDNEHGHDHGHAHGHGQDPFANPSKYFMWRYSLRNFIRRRSYYKELLKHLNLKGSETVLDFGSGTGTLAKKLAPKLKQGQLFCLDVSENLLNYTKNQLKKRSNVTFLLGDLINQSLQEKTFDYIVSTWVLHHLERDTLKQTINGFGSIIKDSGKIFIIEFPDEYEHKHRIHKTIKPSEILKLFSELGFSNKILLRKEGGILYEITK